MAYADGRCDKEPVFSWEDFVDPVSSDFAPSLDRLSYVEKEQY
jgi:hypothetical protein